MVGRRLDNGLIGVKWASNDPVSEANRFASAVTGDSFETLVSVVRLLAFSDPNRLPVDRVPGAIR